MNDESTFEIKPLPPIPVAHPRALAGEIGGPVPTSPLGLLEALPGTWEGTGFNAIWRPNRPSTGSDRFLELNLTTERLVFSKSIGDIPNRGLLQEDIVMNGLTYIQRISDANMKVGLHVEPGIWATVPPTTNPQEPATVVRMGSIPHGTTLLAQGLATVISGPPTIPNSNINPFGIGNPSGASPFPEQNLATPTQFRSEPAQLVGITQAMIDNPNSVLQSALVGHTVTKTTQLDVSSNPTLPVLGGGTANTAFLQGSPGAGQGPNAIAVVASATFWIETVKSATAGKHFLQLQYTQTVLLNFNGLSWPHISVATLRKH
jgi:hypothetical protein